MDKDELFEILFERYRKAVCFFFGNRGLSREDTCDLAQETFLEVYKSLQRLDNEDHAKPWILRIARNLWLNRLRSARTSKRDAPLVPIEDSESGEILRGAQTDDKPGALDRILKGEEQALLRQALDGLPPQMRQCVMFRVDHEMKYREIAAVMGLSIQTVKSHLGQAKKRLQDRLSNHLDWTRGLTDGE